jgi:peptidoglycan/xylan/chitin deacetylase (PgdA/CDA1 family)
VNVTTTTLDGDALLFLRAGDSIAEEILGEVTEIAATRPCVVVREEDRERRWEDVLGYGRPAALAVPRAAYAAAELAERDAGAASELGLLLRIGVDPAVIVGLLASGSNERGLAEDAGAHAPQLVAEHPGALDRLPIGAFAEAAPLERGLRRLLLTLRLPAGWLPGNRSSIERYAYWRGVRAATDRETWQRLTYATTILMYHAFGERGERASRFVVPAGRFRRQLRLLRALRRPVVTLGEYVELRRSGQLPPPRTVVITIDDGYLDTATVAFPVLRSAGVPATLFPVTGSLGSTNRWDPEGELAGRRLLDAEELRTLAEGGIEIGNHTRSHPHLPALAPSQVREELVGAQEELERLGIRAGRLVAYPHGLTSREVQRAVEESGFLGACGVRAGLNGPRTPLFALRRTIVDGRYGLLRFAVALSCGDASPLGARRGSMARIGRRE